MNNLELTIKINQLRHNELIELAEQERQVKLAPRNQPGNQIFGAKIIALFKPYPASDGDRGKTSRERSITDSCRVATR